MGAQVEECIREHCRDGDTINGAQYRSAFVVEQTALVGTRDVAGKGIVCSGCGLCD